MQKGKILMELLRRRSASMERTRYVLLYGSNIEFPELAAGKKPPTSDPTEAAG